MPETLNTRSKTAQILGNKFKSATKNLKAAQSDIAELVKKDEKFVEYYNKLNNALKFKDEQEPKQEQQKLVDELKREFRNVTKVRDTFKFHINNFKTVLGSIDHEMTEKEFFVQQVGQNVKHNFDLFDDVVRTLKEKKEKLEEKKLKERDARS